MLFFEFLACPLEYGILSISGIYDKFLDVFTFSCHHLDVFVEAPAESVTCLKFITHCLYLLSMIVTPSLELILQCIKLPPYFLAVIQCLLHEFQIILKLPQLTIQRKHLHVVVIKLCEDVTDLATLTLLLIRDWFNEVIAHSFNPIFEIKPVHS